MTTREQQQGHQVTFNDDENAEIEYDEQEIEDDPEVYRQFITLVDGVVGSLALLQADMDNFLYFKDELMQQLLPPNLLLQLSLISGKLFRSYSDLQFPLWELLRLARVYSSPWEEKKAALQKMHEDYARKKSQLEIALRRLTTQEAEVKRAGRDRRIMNWEKLFSRVQMARGHGRRWKFRMHDFKKRAAKGVEHLGRYFAEDQSDLESDAEPSEVDEDAEANVDEVEDEVAEVRESSAEESLQREATEEKTAAAAQQVAEDFPEIELESMSEIHVEPDEPLLKEQTDVKSVSMPAEIAQPIETADAEVWTHEPEFGRRLHLRVYPAKQVKAKQVTVEVEFGDEYGDEEIVSHQLDVQDVLLPAADEKRRMPRRRQGGASDENGGSGDGGEAYQEVSFAVPDGIAPEQGGPALRLIVQNERMDQVGTVVLSLRQLNEAGLLTLDVGDDGNAVDEVESENRRRTLDDLGPADYPLLLNDIEAGQVPMLIYWTRWPVLRAVDRDNNTASVYELVEELTGIDLNRVTKEELNREKIDACMSPRPMTPQPEKVPREQFDKLNEEFSEKFTQLEQDYIEKLKALEAQLDKSSSAEQSVQRQSTQERATSAQRSLPGSRRSSGRRATPQSAQQTGEEAPQQQQSQLPPPKKTGIRVPPRPQRPQKNFMVGRPLPAWGEGLPDDFFERMELLTHLTKEHKARLIAQIRAEIAREVEAQLMELSRLAAGYDDGDESGDDGDDKQPRQQPQGGQQTADEVTIPALFMPQRGEHKVYNPRAHLYFQPHGIRGARLTQPPSMLSLPPLPNRTSILNLFDLSNRSGQAAQSVSVSAPPPNASIQTQLSLLRKAAN